MGHNISWGYIAFLSKQQQNRKSMEEKMLSMDIGTQETPRTPTFFIFTLLLLFKYSRFALVWGYDTSVGSVLFSYNLYIELHWTIKVEAVNIFLHTGHNVWQGSKTENQKISKANLFSLKK